MSIIRGRIGDPVEDPSDIDDAMDTIDPIDILDTDDTISEVSHDLRGLRGLRGLKFPRHGWCQRCSWRGTNWGSEVVIILIRLQTGGVMHRVAVGWSITFCGRPLSAHKGTSQRLEWVEEVR